jgi:cytochrome bd ubiquinol oxidase subunit II
MVTFWVAVLALAVLLYVLLDGFDLGVGILFGFAHTETSRRDMMRAVAPVWDGNETWLVVAGVVLWGAFPLAYSILFSALYVPVLFMLTGLILRGVAFEFRERASEAFRGLWSAAFFGGSLLAAFTQGVMVGALVEGLAVGDGHYVGGAMSWLTPFTVLSAVGLCLGYALLGACWLIRKAEGELRDVAWRWISWLAVGLLAVLIEVFMYAQVKDLRILHRWLERPYLFVFPLVAVAAAAKLALRVRRSIRLPDLIPRSPSCSGGRGCSYCH